MLEVKDNFSQLSSVTSELRNALIFGRRANVNRYRRLLHTYLTEIERQFIERRLAEEEKALAQNAVPVNLHNAAAWGRTFSSRMSNEGAPLAPLSGGHIADTCEGEW